MSACVESRPCRAVSGGAAIVSRAGGSLFVANAIDIGRPSISAASRSYRPPFNRGVCFRTRRTGNTQAPLSSLIAPSRAVPGSSAYGVNVGGGSWR